MFRIRLITAGLIIVLFLMIACLSSGIAWMKTPVTEAYNRASLIRLHVVANSDSILDQEVKLKVRDRIIQVTEPLLLGIEDPGTAGEVLAQNLGAVEAAAKDELAKNGQVMPVQIYFGKFQFPERVYPFGTLPAGEYQGVRVILGKGEGRNWWCVLYPPLCLLVPNDPAFKGTPPLGSSKIEYHLAALEKIVQDKGLSMDEFWRSWGKYFGMQ